MQNFWMFSQNSCVLILLCIFFFFNFLVFFSLGFLNNSRFNILSCLIVISYYIAMKHCFRFFQCFHRFCIKYFSSWQLFYSFERQVYQTVLKCIKNQFWFLTVVSVHTSVSLWLKFNVALLLPMLGGGGGLLPTLVF